MRHPLRIPIWAAVPVVALLRLGARFAYPSHPAPAPATATATVTVPATVPPRTPSPARTMTPAITETPRPTRTPVPPPTAIPPTEAGTILGIGDTWLGDGLGLTARKGPYRGSYDFETLVDFIVENRTTSTLNFEVAESVFSLELSTGGRYRGGRPVDPGAYTTYRVQGAPVLNDFKPGEKREFHMHYAVMYPELQRVLRQPAVAYLDIAVRGFSPRLHEARWREEVAH